MPGTRVLPEGAHPKLDELCKLRRKPRIRHAHCLTADTTVSHGHGQMHSKFWLLHFVSTQACNPMHPRLQPYVSQAATLCISHQVLAAALRLDPGARAATLALARARARARA